MKLKKYVFWLNSLYKRALHNDFWKHHPLFVPAATLIILTVAVLTVFIAIKGKTVSPNNRLIVQVYYDGKARTVPTQAKTVGELLDRINVRLGPRDVVEPSLNTVIYEDNFMVNVYRARPITIIDNNTRSSTMSAAFSDRLVLAQANVKTYPEDTITRTSSDNLLENGVGEKIIINRATPVHLNLYGTDSLVRTHVKTVKDLLAEKKVVLAADDKLSVPDSTPVSANMQLFVTRFGTQIATVDEPIAPEVQTVEDGSLSFGTTVVRQQGVAGKRTVTYQISLQNGKESSRAKIQDIIVQDAVPQIIAKGKAISIPEDKSTWMSQAGISQSDYPYVNYIVSRESGWCPTKWQGQAGYCPGYYSDLHSITSGYGYGLCQSTPAGKMASAGDDWRTNPVTQLRWCSGYAQSAKFNAYGGGWLGAYNYWVAHNNW